MLLAKVPLATYERLRLRAAEVDGRRAFQTIAETLWELGTYVRFIAADLSPQSAAERAQAARALTPLEIKRLDNKWIGVSGGYLGDFCYASHEDFYTDLGLAIDPNSYEGTTRYRFQQILGESPPDVQAKILEGILTKYPVESDAPHGSDAARTPQRCRDSRVDYQAARYLARSCAGRAATRRDQRSR